MRLVGPGVADSRQHRHLALAVERCERAERGMPAQAGILGERRSGRGGQREPGAKTAIERVLGRIEHRQRVGAAVEEDRDQDALRGTGGRRGDAVLEQARRERVAAVDGKREAGAARKEAAAREAGTRRQGHPGLDCRQARRPPRRGLGGAVRCVRSRYRGEPSSQQVWKSGEVATSWRSAFAINDGYERRFQLAFASAVARLAKASSARLRLRPQRGGAPEGDCALDEQLRLRRHLARVLVGQRVRLRRVVRDPPAAPERGRVEPATVVPAGDARRHEEPLAGHVREPRPRLGVDAASEGPQEARRVDGRRLHHPRPGVEGRVAEDRLHDRPDVAVLSVRADKGGARRGVRLRRHEVAPELVDEEGRVAVVLEAEPHGVLPVERSAPAEDALAARVVELPLEVEVGAARCRGATRSSSPSAPVPARARRARCSRCPRRA